MIQGLQISLVVILRSIELNLAVLIQEEVAVVRGTNAVSEGDGIGLLEVGPVKAQRSLSALLFLKRGQDVCHSSTVVEPQVPARPASPDG